MMRAALLAASCLALAAPALGQPARPNIVLIIADDWGYSDPGSYGSEIATPHIDALARAGTRFANFHVAGSCSPTRAMLLTGVSSHRAGLGNMPETIPPEHRGKPGYDAVLNRRVVTLADRLGAAGYATSLSGKWHLGDAPGNLPNDRGFDHSLALAQSGADNFENKPNLLLYQKAAWTEDGRPAKLPRRFYSSTLITDHAIRSIDAAGGKPFFATIAYLANHIPVQAPDADIAAYKGHYDGGWDALRGRRAQGVAAQGLLPPAAMVRMATTPDWAATDAQERARRARAMEAYAGMATAMDREVGRLVAHLKETGAYDNTVFVFVSDNGAEATDPMLTWFPRANLKYHYNSDAAQQGRPGSFTAIGAAWASAAASPLSGYKFTASEGGLRVPFIIAWPGNKAVVPGSIARGFAHATDLAPTLLAMAGAGTDGFPGKEAMRGRDLSPMLAGADRVHPDAEAIGYELSGNAALFQGHYKLVKNLAPYGDGRWHLFDIVGDPGETRDLAIAMPERFTAMQRAWAEWAKGDKVLPMPPGYAAPRQIQANALRELLLPRLLPLLAALGALVIGWWGARLWRQGDDRTRAA